MPFPPACSYLRSWAGDASAGPAAAPCAALEGVPCLSTATTVAPLSPPRSASPCPTSLCGSPSFGAAHHVYCFSAPTSPTAGDTAAAAAAAARAVEAEVRALRSARRAYQRAALSQHEQATRMACGISDALKRGDALAGGAAEAACTSAAPPLRPHSAGGDGIPAGGRRKWKRDLAAELQALCGRAGVDAAAGQVF